MRIRKTSKKQEARLNRAKTRVNNGMLSKAIFVATKERPQKMIAAFNAIYVLSFSVCFKHVPLIKIIDLSANYEKPPIISNRGFIYVFRLRKTLLTWINLFFMLVNVLKTNDMTAFFQLNHGSGNFFPKAILLNR